MELIVGTGIDNITFGMKPEEVASILGEPDAKWWDERTEVFQEEVYEYHPQKLQLTFYHHEDGRLGYIRCANPDLRFADHPIIQQPINWVKTEVFRIPDADWEFENFSGWQSHFFEPAWLSLSVEFGVVIKIELGVPFNPNDMFDW